MASNDLQNITQKTKDRATRTSQNKDEERNRLTLYLIFKLFKKKSHLPPVNIKRAHWIRFFIIKK
jgi:hypothetical protein